MSPLVMTQLLQRINFRNSNLIAIMQSYPERVPSAISAWLQWANNTSVTYPTRSLIKAIEEDWQP